MDIKIQAYWGSKVTSMSNFGNETPETRIVEGNTITICDILVNKKNQMK